MLITALPLITGARGGNGVSAEHQRTVEFWTNERVAQAVPRDFTFDPATKGFTPEAGRPSNPGGGGGGSKGGDSGVVTGSSWNKGGEINDSSGKVLFALGSSYYVCSATVVDDGSNATNGYAIIVTAGHCVFDNETGEFAANWMFIPNYDADPAGLDAQGRFCDSTLYGCWTADTKAIHTGFATAGGFNEQATLHDFAFVKVGPGGHNGLELDTVVPEQGITFASIATDGSVSAHAFGYPAQQKWKGNDLIYCFGSVDTDPYMSADHYRMNECKLNGGSSGGPWLVPFSEGTGSGTVMSVNSYGRTGVTAMHGPLFNSKTQAVYNAAKSGSGNTTTNGG